ncbi:Do family serine endopeptidase [Vibrio breoganii]|uniref:Do family serine endopeptidase n=1 Tax=Vibrio breoganii TaxID=553239 RepID=UPI00080E83F5|nr:Do family serine endopeptidase [Vibrio breoganii]OCH73070.1 serine endoprotease DegQ [Vibrio breoganii]PMI20229.1 serine endoprotease DegQ [Vibrio breoganii]PML19886.1 serine endoprotease DegQ [Vibrio breoganii]PML28944.1 serine endoprotease DegQ [Vibrio breoganii]PML35507.1 serine endoprotease DegQ [Vibrio breoganii]
MKKPLLALSVVALSLSSIIAPLHASAALPVQVEGNELPSLAPMLERVSPAVVSVAVEGTQVSTQRIPESFRFFFGDEFPADQVQERPFRGLGSGVIIDADKGHIVTNYHVINGADTIKVQLTDGREYDAELVGGDKMSDVALLKLEKKAKGLTEIKFADSDKLRVGDFTVAIGNPFGLGQTVTSGIVSALGRSGLNLENLENFIQTDAAINSGNSGGALVNLNGELIGINTAILGPNGGNVGIGFAIPSNMMRNLTDQIIEFGEVKRGMLGVQGGEITSELAEALGYESSRGAFVNQVMPDSAADEAGLQAGDIIVSIDGKRIDTFSELRAKVATLGAGKEIKLGVIRDGDKKEFDVTLGESQLQQTKAEQLHPGLTGAALSNTKDSDGYKGVKVTSVAEGSPAASYQIEQGDIIVGVNRQVVTNLGEFRDVLEKQDGVLALNIQRGDRKVVIVVR